MSMERLYFAYNDQQSPELMEAIIGRQPEMEPAVLLDHTLGIQTVANLSPQVQGILGVNRTEEEMEAFRALVAVPIHGRQVEGLVTAVTPKEQELLDNWDIVGLWMRSGRAEIQDRQIRLGSRIRFGSVHVVEPRTVRLASAVFNGTEIPLFLNDPERTKEIARLATAEHLAA